MSLNPIKRRSNMTCIDPEISFVLRGTFLSEPKIMWDATQNRHRKGRIYFQKLRVWYDSRWLFSHYIHEGFGIELKGFLRVS